MGVRKVSGRIACEVKRNNNRSRRKENKTRKEGKENQK
jgi:hypothetical protein